MSAAYPILAYRRRVSAPTRRVVSAPTWRNLIVRYKWRGRAIHGGQYLIGGARPGPPPPVKGRALRVLGYQPLPRIAGRNISWGS